MKKENKELKAMNILRDNGKYFFFNSLTIEKTLQPKPYLFNFDDFGNCWLEDIESFKLPEKVYDVNKELRGYIQTSFSSYKKNLGVLLTGNKGQGKSLTAKLISSEMGLPTIIISKPIPQSVGFVKFFNDIKQNHILFVDEFEKLFKQNVNNVEKNTDSYHGQDVFLSFMDGVLTNEHKVIFLLTTNEPVNEYFINRPSRIKFLLEYNELPEELFNLITDDKLNNLSFKADLEENVSLINLNIDLLISIIDDINLFNKPFSEFKDLYNYKFEEYKYEVYHIIDGKEDMKGFFTSSRKLRVSDKYINSFNVNEMVKFTKDLIMYKATDWYEDKKGKELQREITVKLIPYKHSGISTKFLI